MEAIAQTLRHSSETVFRVLKEAKIPSRQWRLREIDESFWDSIYTEYPAYWLGFILADGYLRYKRNKLVFCLRLATKDSKHLQNFIDDVKTNHKLTSYKNEVSVYISNQRFTRGLQEKLSADIRSCVPESQIHHFVRGYFDGDGSVHCNKRNQIHFGIVGTKPRIISQLHEILLSHGLNIRLYLRDRINHGYKNHGYKTEFSLQQGGNIIAARFSSWLYQNATRYLARKKRVFVMTQEASFAS